MIFWPATPFARTINSDRVYAKLGTPYAVEQIVADYFGTGEVREWYQELQARIGVAADDVAAGGEALVAAVLLHPRRVETYDIEIVYYTTPESEAEVIANVEGTGGAIDRYNEWQVAALGRDINPDQLRKRILSPSRETALERDGQQAVGVVDGVVRGART